MNPFGDRDGNHRNLDWHRRIALSVLAIASVVVFYTIIYHWAVMTIAGVEDRSIITSAQIVIETLTTAGFGGDTGLWLEHTELAFLVLVMNLSGVFLVFLAIPVFAVPLIRNALDPAPPRETDLEDHIIICGYSAIDDVLKTELEAAAVPYLVVESDPDRVMQLIEAGINAIHGDSEQTEVLERANATDAKALVADLDDEVNPTVILSAKRVNPDLHVVSVVQNRESVPYHQYAGADDVVVSKHSLGESMAKRSMKTTAERFQEVIDVESDVQFDEYLVEENSDYVGRTIREIDDFGEDVTIIGGWFGARFIISPPPETTILGNTILFVSGPGERFAGKGMRSLPSHQGHPSRVIVCGYGDSGRPTAEILRDEDIDVTVVDERDIPAVDVVGDITHRGTLERADITNARSVVIAIDNDPTAIYTALLIKNMAPDIEIITRANDPDNVWKLYNAGSDYVISLPSVTGEVLASTLIEESEILTPTDDFDFIRHEVTALAGQTLADADIRNRTGCTAVAVERGSELHTGLGPGFELDSGDILILAGTLESLSEFESVFES